MARSTGSLEAIPHATEATRNTALPANMQAPATEAVGKGAGRKEGAGEGKTVGVDDPGQAGDAQSNVSSDGRHRDHDRGHIEHYQEGAQAKSERRSGPNAVARTVPPDV